tara:strand:- start:1644 stop:2837 length:1194 start_codon:yes stop_codon:yes gene_type:complete
MRIISVGASHDCSLVILDNGEIVYYLKEESMSGIKRDSAPMKLMHDAIRFMPFDYAIYSSATEDAAEMFGYNFYKTYMQKIYGMSPIEYNGGDTKYPSFTHHLTHAAQGFYNSGFEEAYSVVVDGMGSMYVQPDQNVFTGREHESIYEASYPCNFHLIHKNNPSWYGITLIYAVVTQLIGETDLENGKLMGLSSYGIPDQTLPSFFEGTKPNMYRDDRSVPIPIPEYSSYHPNRSLIFHPLIRQLEGASTHHEMVPEIRFIVENIIKDTKPLRKGELTPEIFQEYANLAAKVQKDSEEAVLNLIYSNCDFNLCKNICLTGGYGLNCLNNFRLTQELPSDVNLYIEPNSDDAGNSWGAAKHLWHHITGDRTIRPLKNIYQGGGNVDYSMLETICQDLN